MCDCACDELREDVAELRETVERQQSEIDRAHRRNSQLEETVDELREELEAKDDRIMQLEVTVDQQADRIEELEGQEVATDGGSDVADERIEELEADVDFLTMSAERRREEVETLTEELYGHPDVFSESSDEDVDVNPESLPSIHERVEDVETTLQGADPDVTPAGSGAEEDDQNELTPLERLVTVSEENASEALTANEWRAWHVAKDIDEYQSGTAPGGGKLLDSASIGKVLKSAEENAHTETVRRVMDILEHLSNGMISSKKRRGRRVMVIDDELIEGIQRWRSSELKVDTISSQRGVIDLRESGGATA